MENECEALPGVAYPGVRDNRSTINTKTGYDDDDEMNVLLTRLTSTLWTTMSGELCLKATSHFNLSQRTSMSSRKFCS